MEEKEEAMTKDEMQRYLNQLAEMGVSEDEAYRMLMEVLGVKFPKIDQDEG